MHDSTVATEQVPGAMTFAGMLMILAGALHLVQGLVALVNDDFYVTGEEYMFRFDLTSWGWIHLVGGLAVVLVGAALVAGRRRAGMLAVVVASLSILVNFLWMPYYPLWSLTVIAFDVFVVWAVVAHRRERPRAAVRAVG